VIEKIIELKAFGNASVKNFIMVTLSIGENRIRLKSNIMKGKKEIMIKKDACAENAET
jgi:hypothetical protein